MKRYALYFAPDHGSVWWQKGCAWLGREPQTGQILPQPTIDGIDAGLQHKLTNDARHYGFHATLKAPFRLRQGCTVEILEQALRDFCKKQGDIILTHLEVQWMGGFLALRPTGEQNAINDFAFRCVSEFDQFRAPVSPAESARRMQHPLSLRQLGLLERWGYPYTEEEFRFHMTVTDRLEPGLIADQLHVAATQYFQLNTPLVINGVSLFVENQPGADFQLLERFPFA